MARNSRLPWLLGLLAVACLLTVNMVALGFQFEVFEGSYLPFGARLMVNGYLPQKTYPRVVLLGNSVFQYTSLVQELRAQRNELGPANMFEVSNYSAVGSSIADYLFTYEHVRQFKPDLVVIHLTPHTYFNAEPLFRTDLKELIFTRPYRRFWSLRPIREAYSRNDLAEAVIFAMSPAYRALPVFRVWLRTQVPSSWPQVLEFFPWRLNSAEEWRLNQASEKMRIAFETGSEYESSYELTLALIERLKEDHTGILFVIQERNRPIYPVEQKLLELSRKDPSIHVLDLSRDFRKEEFADLIHPNPIGSRKSASKILPAILDALRSRKAGAAG